MDTRIRRKLSMASRVLSFSRAHPSEDPGYVPVVERLAARIAEAEQLTNAERLATVDERKAINARRSARRKLRGLVLHIAHVAELVVEDRPDLKGDYAPPRYRATNRSFLSDAQVLHDKVVANQALFTERGLGVGLLDEMQKAIEVMATAGDSATLNRDSHRISRGAIMDAVADCMRLVDVLDTFNKARFADQPALLAGWTGVRDIYGTTVRREDQVADDGVVGTIPPVPTGDSGSKEEAA